VTPYVLIDECVPRRLTREFPKGTAVHVRDLEWTGLKNGRLLAAMREKSLTVLVTVYTKLSFQRNLGTSGIAVFVMQTIVAKLLSLATRLHIAAALYHQFIRRDGLLSRMGFGQR